MFRAPCGLVLSRRFYISITISTPPLQPTNTITPTIKLPYTNHPATPSKKKHGPISLTPAELSLYNGTDVSLPIYLAINGTIYDVSASPSFYGPGGGYHFFAGNDGTRAFVTGCFSEDVTPDLRGVEEMFLPVDDDDDKDGDGKGDGDGDGKGDGDGDDKKSEEGGRLSKAERKIRREQVT